MEPIILPFIKAFPKIANSCFVAPGAAIIGDVEIGVHSSVWFNCTVRGDVNHIRIGSYTNIQDNSTCHVTTKTHPLIIGDHVTIGHGAILHGCTVKNYALVGMGSCILDGAVIEERAMVAAGSLVTPNKVVKTGELWAGSPAKFMRKLTDEELKYLEWSPQHYARLAEHYTTQNQ